MPEVIAIAGTHGVSAAQVGLKWIVQQGLLSPGRVILTLPCTFQ